MRILIFLFSFLIAAASLRAESPGVAAGFQPDSAEVGETVHFIVQLTNLGEADRPPVVKAEGLDFRSPEERESTGAELENGRINQAHRISYVWEVTPARAGQFTVPSIQVQIGGRRYTTQPVGLTVRPAPAAGENADRNGRAEIILPKKTAYVGEALTVEFRLSVDAQIIYRIDQMPTFEAEAFTKTKLAESRANTVVRNGRTYEITSLRSTLTPTKAGKLTVGPAEFQYIAQIPRAEPPARRPRSIFDQFFNVPGSGFSQAQRMTATSPIVELDVKPLPIAGRPANFSGAVGHFELHAQGAPARVKMGDPITMNVTVTGSGNFDRVTAPVLSETDGWRAYPPTSTYKGQDTSGVNGAKNFEIAIIPEEKKQEMPVYEFSYFDPDAEKYVTLKTDRLQLQVEGVAPVLTIPEVRGPTQVAAATPTPAPPKPTDIVGIRYDLGALQSTQPVFSQRVFMLAQIVPFGFLCGMVAVRFWPRERKDRAAALLRRERAELLARLRRERTRAAFFAAASRILQVDSTLRGTPTPEAPVVQEIAEAHAQAHYSGVGEAQSEALPEEERRRVLEALLPLLNRK